jgi:hypothetical protein
VTAISQVPRLYCVEQLGNAIVADHLVLLDLTAGEYLVLDEIATAMWQQLLLSPAHRDIQSVARRFSAAISEVAADMADFAREQVNAGRLSHLHAPEPTRVSPVPYRRPSVARAWWERTRADGDLRAGFASAYHGRTGPPAARVGADAREPSHRVVATFTAAENLHPTRRALSDCLPRSLALVRFLRTAGWPAEHVIGVATFPFQAHAWVEINGQPIREGSTFTNHFTVIQRA